MGDNLRSRLCDLDRQGQIAANPDRVCGCLWPGSVWRRVATTLPNSVINSRCLCRTCLAFLRSQNSWILAQLQLVKHALDVPSSRTPAAHQQHSSPDCTSSRRLVPMISLPHLRQVSRPLSAAPFVPPVTLLSPSSPSVFSHCIDRSQQALLHQHLDHCAGT